MVFRYKNRWVLTRPKPTKETTQIEAPPKEVPVPKKATYEAWEDLSITQCQWSLETFWDEGSPRMKCCGLPVSGGQGLGKRFCQYHVKVSIHEEE